MIRCIWEHCLPWLACSQIMLSLSRLMESTRDIVCCQAVVIRHARSADTLIQEGSGAFARYSLTLRCPHSFLFKSKVDIPFQIVCLIDDIMMHLLAGVCCALSQISAQGSKCIYTNDITSTNECTHCSPVKVMMRPVQQPLADPDCGDGLWQPHGSLVADNVNFLRDSPHFSPRVISGR